MHVLALTCLSNPGLHAMDDREVAKPKTQKCLNAYLYTQAYHGNTAVLERALDNNPDLVFAIRHEQNNNTLLHAAALGNQAQTIRVLLNRGAEVDARNSEGQTPLAIAALTAQTLDSIRALNDAGAQIDNIDNYGRTPLMAAVVKGLIEAVKLLVNANADINHPTADSSTALDMALDSNNEPIITYLRSYGAEAYRRNKTKTRYPLRVGSPVHKKQKHESNTNKNNNKENTNIEANRQTVTTEVTTAITHTPIEQTRTYAAAAAPAQVIIHAQERQNPTRTIDVAFHQAVTRQNRDEISRALFFGADINSLVEGQTALHHASFRGDAHMVEFLLSRGASSNITNAQGLTPAQVARDYSVMRLFIQEHMRNQQARAGIPFSYSSH